MPLSSVRVLCWVQLSQPAQKRCATGFLPGLTVRPPPPDPSPVPSSSGTYHAVIGGIVAFIVFLLLILLIFLGHYLIRHKGQRRAGSGRAWERAGR